MYRLIKIFRLTKLLTNYCFMVCLSSGLFTVAAAQAASKANSLKIGQPATAEQIAGWDIDVRPDGLGLPEGSGSVADGEILYEEQCASCHGVFGEGEGRWPMLAGGLDTLTEDRPEKTVGSYWPYLSTLWDYIHRAMPFLSPQTLEDDEVYAITAYILYLNELVEDDFVLTRDNFTSVKLPNEVAFVDDPRPDVENRRCMKNCKDPESIKITWDSTALGVTPTDHLQQDKVTQETVVADVAPADTIGLDTYKAACAMCHDTGIAGAPSLNDQNAWQTRIAQGMAVLNKHALEGFQGGAGYMPAKGGNASLSDAAVKAAVAYMLQVAN